MVDTAKMKLSYGSQSRLLTTGLNINDLNEEGRQKALTSLKEGIDEAYELRGEMANAKITLNATWARL